MKGIVKTLKEELSELRELRDNAEDEEEYDYYSGLIESVDFVAEHLIWRELKSAKIRGLYDGLNSIMSKDKHGELVMRSRRRWFEMSPKRVESLRQRYVRVRRSLNERSNRGQED